MRDYLVDEAHNLGTLQVKDGMTMTQCDCRLCHQCDGEQECEYEALFQFQELMSFRCEYSAIRIPKPANRVTTDVPP